MTGSTPITFDAALILFGFAGTLWAIFTAYARLDARLRDQRILINVICSRLGIDPNEITGGDK